MLTPREQTELAHRIAMMVVKMLDAQGGRPALVDSHGLANALGVSVSTLDRWTAQGLIPVKIWLGNVRRYAVDEVIESLSKTGKVAG